MSRMRSKAKLLTRTLAALVLPLAAVSPIWSDSLAEALQAHRYSDAVVLADTLLKKTPDDPRIWTVRGGSLAALGRDKEALSSFERALEVSPQFASALQGAVQSAYRARDTRAAALVDRLLRVDPQNGVAHAIAATLKFEAGDCSGAMPHFEQSLAQIAANEQASSLYAACLIEQRRPSDAVKVLLPFTHGAHPAASTWNLIASAENASGHPEEAADSYKKAIDAAPGDEQNYIDLECPIHSA